STAGRPGTAAAGPRAPPRRRTGRSSPPPRRRTAPPPGPGASRGSRSSSPCGRGPAAPRRPEARRRGTAGASSTPRASCRPRSWLPLLDAALRGELLEALAHGGDGAPERRGHLLQRHLVDVVVDRGGLGLRVEPPEQLAHLVPLLHHLRPAVSFRPGGLLPLELLPPA